MHGENLKLVLVNYTLVVHSLLNNIQCEMKRNEAVHVLLGPATRLLSNVTKHGRKEEHNCAQNM